MESQVIYSKENKLGINLFLFILDLYYSNSLNQAQNFMK